MADGYFITSQESHQVETLAGVHRRTLATTDEVMLCEFFLERDSEVPEHSHLNDQVGYLVYGKLEMTVGGISRTCESGDTYAIPGGILHSARALQNTLVIDAFSPPRNDYAVDAR